jgi:hypothetical protein
VLPFGHQLHDFDERADRHFEPGLFAELARERLLEAFAAIDATAGQRPPAPERRLIAPHQANTPLRVDGDRTHGQYRAIAGRFGTHGVERTVVTGAGPAVRS